jgi:hypothetical protein
VGEVNIEHTRRGMFTGPPCGYSMSGIEVEIRMRLGPRWLAQVWEIVLLLVQGCLLRQTESGQL